VIFLKEMLVPIHNKPFQPVIELIEINKQLFGLKQQKDQQEQQLINIKKLIKDLKSSRETKVNQVVGNLLMSIDKKKAIQMLQGKKEEVEIGIKALDEQLMHRRDGFESAAIKVYKMLLKYNCVPEDILNEP